MASSIFIGWFGGVPWSTSGTTITFSGDVAADRFLGGDGTAALPTFSFSGTGDGDNGVYLSAADTVGVSAGGTLRLSVSSTAVTSAVPIQGANLTVSASSGTLTLLAPSGPLELSPGNLNIFTNGSLLLDGDTYTIQFGDAQDVSLSRGAANRLTLATGDVMNLAPTAFASLPTGAEGDMACVTDSNTATWGATIAGSGANNVLAYFNGTNWTVAGA